MKRRKFIRNLGAGMTPALLPYTTDKFKTGKGNPPEYEYKQPATLQEAVTKDRLIIVRLEFRSEEPILHRITPEIKIENGQLLRSKNYFFEAAEDDFFTDPAHPQILSSSGDIDIIVLWLDQFSDETTILLTENSSSVDFKLSGIIDQRELTGKIDQIDIKANFLLDREIGEIDPAKVGIEDSGNDFTFILMPDTQGGDSSIEDRFDRCRMKIHNAFIEESVKLANCIPVDPAFCLVLGDIVDHIGDPGDFRQMQHYLDQLDMPVLYAIGNHESAYNATFSPGYNFDDFNHYFVAQKSMNGMEKLLYSFNLGRWHFVVWPDPLRHEFWENHPHYFDWLEEDLEKHKDQPTVFFQHVPTHPIGINPLVNYVNPVPVKRLLLDILSRYGNVKTVFSGHVHIPLKSSVKTAVSMEGINFINLPAAGYRPRAFGEEDYFGGPAQGICIVEVKGEELTVTYKTVTDEEVTYPDKLPAFEAAKFPLWLNQKWELPAQEDFINGDFGQGLEGWRRRYIYTEDQDPSNLCEVSNDDHTDNKPALYLMSRKRGYDKPGQDRMPQGLNRVFQAVSLQPGKHPVLSFEYKLEGSQCDFSGLNGFYVLVEGFQGSLQMLDIQYIANKAWTGLGRTYSKSQGPATQFYSLPNAVDEWHKARLDIAGDFGQNSDDSSSEDFTDSKLDRLVVSAGIWNVNDGRPQPFAAFLRNVGVSYEEEKQSQVNNQPISSLPQDHIWWLGKDIPFSHVAGEHRYVLEGNEKLKYGM